MVKIEAELTDEQIEKLNELESYGIGFGKLEQEIRRWVKEEGITDITNILINPDDISGYLSKADIYLSTSLFEGTSNSIMEGMNADLPIIATNVGDNAYLVEEGKNGHLTEKKDIDALIEERSWQVSFRYMSIQRIAREAREKRISMTLIFKFLKEYELQPNERVWFWMEYYNY